MQVHGIRADELIWMAVAPHPALAQPLVGLSPTQNLMVQVDRVHYYQEHLAYLLHFAQIQAEGSYQDVARNAMGMLTRCSKCKSTSIHTYAVSMKPSGGILALCQSCYNESTDISGVYTPRHGNQ